MLSEKKPFSKRQIEKHSPPHDAKKQKSTYKPIELAANKILLLNTALSTIHYHHYEFDIKSLDDLLLLGAFYKSKAYDKTKHTNLPFYNIALLTKAVNRLIGMVGLDDLKASVLTMIIFYLQELDGGGNQDMLHTVVYGGPGVGKTKFIHILAEIYAHLGVLPTKKVTFLKRADLIGQYLGHTAIKTRDAIENAKGGILVIDEAYSLGDTQQKDSFSRECIDTLNQYLSEEKKNLICVIAGYKEDIEERFFKTNPGLKRRFPFKFTITDYTPKQLKDIFIEIVRANNWKIAHDAVDVALLTAHKEHFLFNGGDMELIFTKAKFMHGMRVFSAENKHKKIITTEDFEKAVSSFVLANPKTPANACLSTLYM